MRPKLTIAPSPELSDPKDDMVLEVAVVGNCEAIVTYNKRGFGGAADFDIALMTPAELLAEIGGRQRATRIRHAS